MTELEKQYEMVREAASLLRVRWADEIIDTNFESHDLHTCVSVKASALKDLLLEMSDMLVNERQALA